MFGAYRCGAGNYNLTPLDFKSYPTPICTEFVPKALNFQHQLTLLHKSVELQKSAHPICNQFDFENSVRYLRD